MVVYQHIFMVAASEWFVGTHALVGLGSMRGAEEENSSKFLGLLGRPPVMMMIQLRLVSHEWIMTHIPYTGVGN
jgi:hypothetical protein